MFNKWAMASTQEEDNVIPPRTFCAFSHVNAAFRKSSLTVVVPVQWLFFAVTVACSDSVTVDFNAVKTP